MRHVLKVWRNPSDRISALRIVTLICLFAPLSKVIYDFDAISLDARPITNLIHRTGDWALIFLLVVLAARRHRIDLHRRRESLLPCGHVPSPRFSLLPDSLSFE